MAPTTCFFSSASGCPIASKNKEKYQSHATSGITYAEKYGGNTYAGNSSNADGSNEASPIKDKADQPMDTSEGPGDEKVVPFLPFILK